MNQETFRNKLEDLKILKISLSTNSPNWGTSRNFQHMNRTNILKKDANYGIMLRIFDAAKRNHINSCDHERREHQSIQLITVKFRS